MIRVNGRVFDLQQGVVLKPEVAAIPFRNAATEGIGGQITAARGPGFTLTLTTYDKANQIDVVTSLIRQSIGAMVPIVETFGDGDIDYFSFGHGRLLFFVVQARVVERRVVSSWCGYRYGTHYEFKPACRIVSQWTMFAQAIPLI